MNGDQEERIRARAHAIWEGEGRPEGREHEHWEQARRELEGEDGGEQLAGATNAAGAGGLATGLQPGGTMPGASVGSIGTGGGSTAGHASGSADRDNAT